MKENQIVINTHDLVPKSLSKVCHRWVNEGDRPCKSATPDEHTNH